MAKVWFKVAASTMTAENKTTSTSFDIFIGDGNEGLFFACREFLNKGSEILEVFLSETNT